MAKPTTNETALTKKFSDLLYTRPITNRGISQNNKTENMSGYPSLGVSGERSPNMNKIRDANI